MTLPQEAHADEITFELATLLLRGETLELVDEIGDVLRLSHDLWRSTPDTLPASHRVFVFGICPTQSQIVLGLRVDTLSGDDERPDAAGDRPADGTHA